jgi:hypothetical protein
MFFERKKARKRNVATRQPARDVRHGFCLANMALKGFELESQFSKPRKLTVKAKLNKTHAAKATTKSALSILQLLVRKVD